MESVTSDLLGSLEKTCIFFTTGPDLPFVSIFAVIFPFSPGFKWLELAIAAVQPQDEVTFSITRSSVPAFVIIKSCLSVLLFSIVPKS
jgi:hypothetical protein